MRSWMTAFCPLVLGAGLLASQAAAAPVVQASSVHSGPYPARYAVDGNPQTRWASKVGSKTEWIQIDLGQTTALEGVSIHWETACALHYQLQVSEDGKTWKTLRDVRDGTRGQRTFAGLAGKGRYVRVLCLTPGRWQLYSIYEITLLSKEAARRLAEARAKAEAEQQAAREAATRRLRELASGRRVREIVFALRQPGRDGHWYANFGYYSHSRQPLYGDGGKLCALDLTTGKVRTLLSDPKGGVRDPVVHYDAKKVLFSYRKGGSEYYNLYEMPLPAPGQSPAAPKLRQLTHGAPKLRQLTHGPYNDIEPCYLPDGRIVFCSDRCDRWVNCWLTPVAVLYVCEGDGKGVRAISANVEHDNTPWPLPDGRILYQRWEYIDRSQVDYHHLWTTNPDGTGQMVFYGNQRPGLVMIDAKPVPDSDRVIAIFSPGHGRREHDGTVTLLNVRSGPNERGTSRAISRGSHFRDPWAFDENLFMAVSKGREIVLLDGRGNERSIYRLSPEDARLGLQVHEPRPVMRRPREKVIADRVNLDRPTGTLMLTDVYRGRNMKGIRRGEIKKLLVLEALPKPVNFTGGMDPVTYGGSFTLERVLGTVPVEPDGSAYLEVPAMRSLFFVALDAEDMGVKRMHSFLTVQPGEATGCVGCHEPRTELLDPPRSATLALRRPPSRIEPVADCPDVLDFPRDVQPILDRLCVDCHGTEKTKRGGPYSGRVLLTGDRGPMFSHAYFTMKVKRLFVDNHNRAVGNLPPRSVGSAASRIWKKIDGSHHGVKATPREKKILRLWIDVGGPYPGTYAALGCGAVGGYIHNRLMNTDKGWPTTRAGAKVIQKRCASCHKGKGRALPTSLCDELGMSFWRFSLDDPRLKHSRHIVFNLSRPEKSLMLLAPLAKQAGGLGLCQAKGTSAPVFRDAKDPDYQALLAMVAAGKTNLDKIKRFDMPDFQPLPQYLREMRRYGILPADWGDDKPVDPYELDRTYWRSLWYTPGK